MKGFLRLAVADAAGAAGHAGVWAGYVAMVALTTTLLGLAVTGVVVTADLEGEAADVLRSWTTPAALLTAIVGVAVLGETARLTHAALSPGRRAWSLLGATVLQWRSLVLLQSMLVTAFALTVGLAAAAMILMVVRQVTLGADTVPLPLRPVVVPLVILGVVLVVCPSTVSALFADPQGNDRRSRVRLVALAVTILLGVVVVIMAASTSSRHVRGAVAVTGVVPIAVATLCIATWSIARLAGATVRAVLRALEAASGRRRWHAGRLGVRAAASVMAASGGVITSIVAGSSVIGGSAAVLLAGDVVLRDQLLIAPGDASVDLVALASLVVAPQVLVLAAMATVFLIGGEDRLRRTATLVRVGASRGVLVRAALAEALVMWASASVIAVMPVVIGAAPVLLAGGASLSALPLVVANPFFVASTLAALVVLVLSAVIGQAVACGRSDRSRS